MIYIRTVAKNRFVVRVDQVFSVGQGRSLSNRLQRQDSGEMVEWSQLRISFSLLHTNEESGEMCLRNSSGKPIEYGSGRISWD